MADVKKAKLERRTAKAAFTRQGNWLKNLIESERLGKEVNSALNKVKEAFENLVLKHENYTQFIEDDDDFEVEEKWMGECQNHFMGLEQNANTYLRFQETKSLGKGKQRMKYAGEKGADEIVHSEQATADSIPTLVLEDNEVVEQNSDQANGMIGMSLNKQSEIMQHSSTQDNGTITLNTESVESRAVDNFDIKQNSRNMQLDKPSTSRNFDINYEEVSSSPFTESRNVTPLSASQPQNCGFKMEKPKMPKFTGDVREYAIFRSDFKHAIESRYGKRDAITFLRACLHDKPLELIKGIGTDYDACWDYLDSIYGDPRFVSDIITQDIVKFRPLQPHEDMRFCELVHLVRRSFNTLKEVGNENDINNSHMLAVIEQKLCADDRKVWSRELERESTQATLEALLRWLSMEMKSRMRASAPLRSSNQGHGHRVHQLTGRKDDSAEGKKTHKCWVCETSSHWPDQCQKLTGMKVDERQKMAKDNHVCYACLKKAGRDHCLRNCSRRRQCPKMENGNQCKYYHHPLLHRTSSVSIGVAASMSQQSTMLPVVTVKMTGKNGREDRPSVNRFRCADQPH